MDWFSSFDDEPIHTSSWVHTSSWEDLREVLYFLYSHERFVLRLIRDGKSISDIATILEMNSRQQAEKEIKHVINVVKFYLKHLSAIKTLYNGVSLFTRRETIIIRLFTLERMSHKKIAKVMKYSSRWSAWDRIKEAKKKLDRSNKYRDILLFINECSKKQGLRKREDVMVSNTWRRKIEKWLLANVGRVWYVWGGQDINKGVADCSGLVIEVLKMVGKLPNDIIDMTAQDISKLLYEKTNNPETGDLVFYGKNWNSIVHVMFYLGSWENHLNAVVGMCGGRKNMKKKQAKSLGAALWIRTNPKYRRDFLGYKKVK